MWQREEQKTNLSLQYWNHNAHLLAQQFLHLDPIWYWILSSLTIFSALFWSVIGHEYECINVLSSHLSVCTKSKSVFLNYCKDTIWDNFNLVSLLCWLAKQPHLLTAPWWLPLLITWCSTPDGSLPDLQRAHHSPLLLFAASWFSSMFKLLRFLMYMFSCLLCFALWIIMYRLWLLFTPFQN